MRNAITDKQRAILEADRRLIAELPAKHADYRAWLEVSPLVRDEVIVEFHVRRYEFKNLWMEKEYDPSDDELVDLEFRNVLSEAEVNAILDRWLPEGIELCSVADIDDFPN